MGLLHSNSNPILRYCARHWRGEFSLSYAFAVNFVGIGLLAYGLSQLLAIPPVKDNHWLFALTIACFMLFWLVIYPWQAMGVIRAVDKNPGHLHNSLWLLPIQGIVLLSSILFFTGATSLVQRGYSLVHQEDERFMEIFYGEPDYQLSLTKDSTVLQINGLIDNGLTKDVRQLLDTYPDIAAIHLNSGGGTIYEARGVARLILERNLDTHVTEECKSSCTTIFVAGKQRTLADQASIGFHQYRFEATYFLPNQEKNIAREQQKDLDFLRSRGIRQDFLDRVFSTPHKEIWLPTHTELATAGVIHQQTDTE